MHGWNAFEPPSDYVPDEGGASGKKKLWVGLGIGCAVILLIIGGFFIYGGFKTVSCCSDLKEGTERTMAAREFAREWANFVYDGELDTAYERTSESFRAELDPAGFEEAVESNRDDIEAAPPRLFNMNTISTGEDGMSFKRWRISFQFAAPSSEEMLLMHVNVHARGEESQRPFVVDDVSFENRKRRLDHEPPAETVLELHDMLTAGRYEEAYGKLSPDFSKSTDLAAFKKFLKVQGDILTDSELEIRRVEYHGADRSTVVAHASAASGRQAIVQYELKSAAPGVQLWQVTTISPMVRAEAEEGSGGDAGTAAERTDGGAAGGSDGAADAAK